MPDLTAGEARLAVVPDVSAFKSKLDADMKRIRAEYALHVTADTGQAKADIQRFRDAEERKGLTQKVDIALAEADARMAAFRARQRGENVKIKADVDTGGALKQIEKLDSAFGDVLGTLGKGLKFNLLISGIGELPAATTAIANVAGALQQLAQAGLAVPGIIGGVVASVGTLAFGLSGISDAYEAVTKAATTSGQDQANQAREAAAATNAHRNAVVDEAQAEKDRTRAVADARREIEDLNISLRGGQLSEEQAKNNALRQRRDLQKDLATGQIKDNLDLQARLLDIAQADQSVVEAHQSVLETTDKVNDANQKGVTGSDKVVAANERVTRSQQSVEQTAADLAKATSQSSSAQQAANLAMSQLSPAGREVVDTLVGLKGQFTDLRNSVQDKIFAGVSGDIKNLVAADLPVLQKGLGNIATSWNGLIHQLAASLGSDSSKGLLDRLLGNTAEAQTRFTKAIDPIVHAIGELTATGSNALPRLADDLGKVADRFDKFISSAADDGRLDKWINDGITGFEHIGDTLLNVGKAFTEITKAAGGGDGLLTALDRGSEKLADFLGSTKGQSDLKRWFQEGRDEIQNHIIPLLKDLPGFFAGIVNAGTEIANTVVPPLRDISHFLSDHPQLIKNVVEAFVAWKSIAGVAELITNLNKISTLFKVTLPADAAVGATAMSASLGPIAALAAAIIAVDPEKHIVGDKSIKSAADQGDWGRVLFGDGWDYIKKALNIGDGGGNAPVSPALPPPNDQKLHPGIIYRDQAGNPIDPNQLGTAQVQQPGIANAPIGPPITSPTPTNKPQRTVGDLKFGDPLPPGYDWDIPTKSVRGPDGHLLLDSTPLPDGYARGGADRGSASGHLAVLHGTPARPEFVHQASAVAKYGVPFMSALNAGHIDPRSLPHFDTGGIDQYGNPITPGTAPGPAPNAPNPTGGGINQIANSFISGIGGPIGNIANLIGGVTNAGQTGAGGLSPGLGGLLQAGSDPNAQQAWGQQTGSWLANWGGNFAAQFATTLFSGVLGFFGLGDSILSPSNPWFQDATKSLGIFNNIGGLGASGIGGTPQLGAQTITLGDGSTVQIPTFGTSQGPDSTGVPGATSQPTTAQPSVGNVGYPYVPGTIVAPAKGTPGQPGYTSPMRTAAPSGAGGNPTANKQLAMQIFSQYFPMSEFGAFDTLEMHEAGYNNTAKNPSSTAYGMGQFLDTTWAPYGPKTADPATQLQYMLQYIKNRYGTPSNAWSQYYNHPGGVGWYDDGGILRPGATLAYNTTGKPERILNPAQNARYEQLGLHTEGAVPTPPRPNFQVPDAKTIAPPRGGAVIPSAPTTPLPAPVQPSIPEPPAPPPPAQPWQVGGPAPAGGAPDAGATHLLPAVSTGIQSGFAAAGNVASAVASAFGGGAGGAAGGLIGGAFAQLGKIATNVANVGASLLVGSVPGSFGDPNLPAYGQTQRPAQNVPQTATDARGLWSGGGRTTNIYGVDTRNIVDTMRLQDAQDQQAQLASIRG